jgi:hypothetical protein
MSFKYSHSEYYPVLRAEPHRFSSAQLKRLEITINNRLANIQRFTPWPALEQSLAGDLEAIWNEQKRRKQRTKT